MFFGAVGFDRGVDFRGVCEFMGRGFEGCVNYSIEGSRFRVVCELMGRGFERCV